MKPLLLGLLVLAARNVVGQEAPSFKGTGAPFVSTNCKIAWAAPTNQMPRALWIYKTIRKDFSEQTISNLVALGSFTIHDKRDLTAEERAYICADYGAIAMSPLVFRNEGEKRSLGISPGGVISYRDQKADEIHGVVEDVPSEPRAQELGLKLLDQIGIPRSELAHKRNGSEPLTFKETGSRRHYDKELRKLSEEEITSQGVFFVRQIDGVTFAGIGLMGGFHVRFTSHARVAELKLVWRNLQPYKKYEVASPDEIMQWIKESKAVVTLPDVNKVNRCSVKKLTISQISPLYMGEGGETRQDFTYPFASLDAIVDTGQTNIGVLLYCPILTKNTVDP